MSLIVDSISDLATEVEDSSYPTNLTVQVLNDPKVPVFPDNVKESNSFLITSRKDYIAIMFAIVNDTKPADRSTVTTMVVKAVANGDSLFTLSCGDTNYYFSSTANLYVS